MKLSSTSATIPRPKMAAPFVLLILLLVTASEAAISCNDVFRDLRPCVNYLLNGSGMPLDACCAGASALASAASTLEDMKAACECIKSATRNINYNVELAQALPQNCGISLPFTVSPDMDCSTYYCTLDSY